MTASGRLLLDTHVFLWAITADARLSAKAMAAYEEGQLLLSVASIWEIVGKYQLGRLELPAPPSQFLPAHIERNAIAVLPIRARHVLRLEKLPLHHRDPYDRVLVAQSLEEELTLITDDPLLLAYEGVSSLW